HSSTENDNEPVLGTARVTESSFETKSTLSTELNAVDNQDSVETAEQSVLIYIVPIALLVLLILLIMIFVMHRKKKKTKQVSELSILYNTLFPPYLSSPIFEEDTPSVMEIEMEELDKWMSNMNKNADCECLPTVKEEEKESLANP
ncbi:TM154 protein, partial [Centropus unirufus]|nr:TM154 protein [Centropus unirufus]